MSDAGKRDLQSVLYQMYQSNIHTDVTIEVRSKETVSHFKAHRLILAMRSPLFADKFHGAHHSSIFTFVVEGVSPSTMEIFLRYIYSDCLSVEKIEEIVEFEKISNYYEINDVRPVCKQALSNYVVNEYNVFSLLEASVYFRMKSLYSQCIALIREKNLLRGSEYLSVSRETLFKILKEINASKKETTNVIFRWLNCNKKADRSMLLHIDFESLPAGQLLDWIEEFPYLLKPKEALNIIFNMLRPGYRTLPPWCRSSSEITDSSLSAAIIADTAIRVETSCDKTFTKASFYGKDGFSSSMRIKLKPSRGLRERIQLLMVELPFGSSYVPEDALNINFFRHAQDFPLIRKIKVNFALETTPENFYLILCEKIVLLSSFYFTLEMNVKGLNTWRSDEIVSDDRYRVMQVDKSCRMKLALQEKEYVHLKPITNSLVFIDLETGKKSFSVTSLYFKYI